MAWSILNTNNKLYDTNVNNTNTYNTNCCWPTKDDPKALFLLATTSMYRGLLHSSLIRTFLNAEC